MFSPIFARKPPREMLSGSTVSSLARMPISVLPEPPILSILVDHVAGGGGFCRNVVTTSDLEMVSKSISK